MIRDLTMINCTTLFKVGGGGGGGFIYHTDKKQNKTKKQKTYFHAKADKPPNNVQHADQLHSISWFKGLMLFCIAI